MKKGERKKGETTFFSVHTKPKKGVKETRAFFEQRGTKFREGKSSRRVQTFYSRLLKDFGGGR